MSGLRFALLAHPYSVDHLSRILHYHQPDMHPVSPEFLKKVFEWTPPYADVFIPFRSGTGDCVEGYYVMVPLLPDTPPKVIMQQTLRALRLADELELPVRTLGGYTSLLGERFPEQVPSSSDTAVTTGNAYTAALTAEGVRRAARALRLDLADLHVMIVGISDIGAAAATALAPECARLTIASRNLKKWHSIVDDLRSARSRRPISFIGDMRTAVSDVDVTIMSVNVFDRSFDFNLFKSGSIVCDVGYPKNLAYFFQTHPNMRPDLFVYCGGYAHVPDRIDFGYDFGLPNTNVTYGCFGEALILALEGRCENYSLGRGRITIEAMDEVMAMGRRHGFDVAPFYLGRARIADEEIREFPQRYPLRR